MGFSFLPTTKPRDTRSDMFKRTQCCTGSEVVYHAYSTLIQRWTEPYDLCPGNKPATCTQYHKILPFRLIQYTAILEVLINYPTMLNSNIHTYYDRGLPVRFRLSVDPFHSERWVLTGNRGTSRHCAQNRRPSILTCIYARKSLYFVHLGLETSVFLMY